MAPLELSDAAIERIEAEAGEVATAALEGLPADQRDAVRARIVDEREYADIARSTRTSEAVVRGLDTARTGDDRPAPPPAPGVTFTLPGAEEARPCPGVSQREMAGEAPEAVRLHVFTRPQTEADVLPSLAGADSYSWIPAGTIHPASSRRPAPVQFGTELHIVAGAEPRRGDGCEGTFEADLGVCLVVGDGDAVVKCFSATEIEAGRALAVTGRGVVHGIVPDGIVSATLRWDGGVRTVPVRDNVLEADVPLAAGATVRVELQPSDTCRPSPELLDAVPALRDGGWDAQPAVAGGKWQWIRHLGGDELDVWVVVPCEEDAERACLLAIRDGSTIALPCATVAEIRGDGTWWQFPVAGRVGVAGIAPHGASRVHVILDGRVYREVTTSGGVFATILPLDYGASIDPDEPRLPERLEVRFR